ncbi:MAG: 3-hydroxyacyl-ACP dehydratase FabZ [Pseudomonadota bacterium]
MASEGNSDLDTLDIMRLLDILPHRYPFLLVDRIVDVDSDNSAIGIKNVTINEPQFQGHFPSTPIFPGVFIVEGMAQTAGAICLHSLGSERPPTLVYFLGIDKCKFRKPVAPGDVLTYHVQKLKKRGMVWKYQCEAKVGDVRVAEAELTAMLAEE